ncbi:hypothetical protein LUZ60_009388 [Juncus effusus]|nr:hypothetical protein LUZ60_009388 [Juncus effusus]
MGDPGDKVFLRVWFGLVLVVLVNCRRRKLMISRIGGKKICSALTWVQCAPCNPHFRTLEPLFEPQLSDSYRLASAYDPLCGLDNFRRNIGLGKCEFLVNYHDGTYAAGDLAFETFGFMSTNTNIMIEQVGDVPFGCVHEATTGYPLNGPDGILGLMSEPESFFYHVMETAGRRFSYCFTPSGSHNNQGYLTFGDHVPEPIPIPGTRTQRTPFLLDGRGAANHYYLNLIDMSVGLRRMNFDPRMFARHTTGSGGTVIDTGSTDSVITTEAFQQIVAAIRTHLQRLGFAAVTCSIYGIDSELCIQVPPGQYPRLPAPSITWHFADGSYFIMGANTIYNWKCDSRVLFFLLRDGGDITLLGARQQVNYRMRFDLEPRTSPYLSFTPEYC